MRLSSTDFPVMNRIAVAREDGIYYEAEKNSLAETWDRLLEYYNERILEDHKEEIEEQELYKMLCKARVEAETGRSVYELIEKGVLEVHKVRPRHVDRCEFKMHILDTCVRLLGKGIFELEDAIRQEGRVWEMVGRIGLPVKLVAGEVRAYVTETEYLVVNGGGDHAYPDNWKAHGLTCTIRYLDVYLEGSVSPQSDASKIEMVKEYFLEKSIVQEFTRNGIEIRVAAMEGPGDKKDTICMYVIEELKGGRGIREIFCKVSLYLSRKLIDIVVDGHKECTVLKHKGLILEDGLPEMFFVLTDTKVIKALRQPPDKFEIYVNEIPARSFGRTN
ncbi:hypothetical protein J0A71_03g05680 [Encephalitozoon cuniculi]|uniref:Uncharacterized protein n=1 Tax=Encephalitozoon cuniculi TaxID=6035 RepID=M1KAI4_ENCCN|nr:hypothetical protein ECU09_0500 [Encephalitozoon cuniculi]UYI26731.1 hypothetical protein J0A71_03g05680 [Encephalitozoon cuniculi]